MYRLVPQEKSVALEILGLTTTRNCQAGVGQPWNML